MVGSFLIFSASRSCLLPASSSIGLETDTRAYFTGVTILISLPTGTKIFNWLSTYLGNPSLLQLKTSSIYFLFYFIIVFPLEEI